MKAESRTPQVPASRGRSEPGPAARRGHGITILEDVTAATEHSGDLQETLQRIVEVIAKRTSTDVCSVYLLEPRIQRVTLCATTGLERSAVGKVSMTVGEGLTGMVVEKLEAVMVTDAMSHPRYKFFPETGEERYHSFLGVPILERGTPLGVLVVQTLRRRKFSATEIRLLRAIAAQVAGVLVQARLLDDLRSKEKERSEYRQRMLSAMKRLHDYENRIEASEVPPRRKRRQGRLNGLPAAPGFGRRAVIYATCFVNYNNPDVGIAARAVVPGENDRYPPDHAFGAGRQGTRRHLEGWCEYRGSGARAEFDRRCPAGYHRDPSGDQEVGGAASGVGDYLMAVPAHKWVAFGKVG